jgi:hypothetical protein
MSTEDRLKGLIGSVKAESRASEQEWNAFAQKAHGALYTRRVATAVGTIALIGVVAFAAVTLRPAGNDNPIGPSTSTSPTTAATPEPTPTGAAPEFVEVAGSEQELWFAHGEKLSWSTTFAGGQIPLEVAGDGPTDSRAGFWLDFLLGGPMGAHQEAGDTTAIPEGTKLLRVMRNGSTLFVDLSSEFESGGGSLSMQMRIAQVVYTATQFAGVDSVRIMIDGEMVDAIGGEGIIVAEPLTRRDFQDLAPNIVVEQPRPGQELSSGDTVSGFANVFEANVSINVVDENGKKLMETFTTATCGTGCWGEFTQALEFTVDHEQEGRLTVLTYSAEDGSPQDEVSIPVRLIP